MSFPKEKQLSSFYNHLPKSLTIFFLRIKEKVKLQTQCLNVAMKTGLRCIMIVQTDMHFHLQRKKKYVNIYAFNSLHGQTK